MYSTPSYPRLARSVRVKATGSTATLMTFITGNFLKHTATFVGLPTVVPQPLLTDFTFES